MTLSEMAVDVLTTADGREKTAKSRRYAAEWFAAREAGALESLWKLGWGTTDAGVQAVVREALEVLTEQSFDFGAGFTEKAKEAVMAPPVTARGGRK